MAVSHSALKTPSATADTKSVPLSRSTCLRERGNTLYHEATSDTLIPSMRGTRLQEAIQLYCQALSLSQSESDRAKCCKNLGQAFWSLSKLSLASVRLTSKQSESLCFNLLSSISYFLEALNHSRPQVQTREWVQGIHWTLVDIVWTVESLQVPNKSRLLSEICSVFQQKVPANMKLQASAIAHKACAELGYKNAMPLPAAHRVPVLHDCLFQLSVARSHTDTSATAFLSEINRVQRAISEEISHCERIKNPNGFMKRNQSFSEERSQSTMDRRIPEQSGARSISFRNQREFQPSDLEYMFTNLSPLDFLTQLYKKYPPPKKESISQIRNLSELRTAYRRAISHYHPDHYKGDSKLPDEITKYLIMNFNGLRSE